MIFHTIMNHLKMTVAGVGILMLTSCNGIFDDIYDQPKEIVPAKGTLAVCWEVMSTITGFFNASSDIKDISSEVLDVVGLKPLASLPMVVCVAPIRRTISLAYSR